MESCALRSSYFISYVDMGADEIYSCDDDLSEDDISHPLDKNMDAIINFHEFGFIAQAWLSTDPNNPLCDPNNPNYVTDPNDSHHISEGDKLRYDSEWDLDSDLFIDFADLALFADIWLYVPCWVESRASRFDSLPLPMGGGQSAMMMMPMPMEASEPETSLKSEVDLASLYVNITEIIDFVDTAIESNPDNSEGLLEVKAGLKTILKDIRKSILGK